MVGLIPELGRSPGGGHGNPLQYSCLEDPMDRGAWQAAYSPWRHKELDTTEQLSTLSLKYYGTEYLLALKYYQTESGSTL